MIMKSKRILWTTSITFLLRKLLFIVDKIRIVWRDRFLFLHRETTDIRSPLLTNYTGWVGVILDDWDPRTISDIQYERFSNVYDDNYLELKRKALAFYRARVKIEMEAFFDSVKLD